MRNLTQYAGALLTLAAPALGLLGCSSGDAAFPAEQTCGNGRLDAGEDCDGAVPSERSCVGEGGGFVAGALSCTSACKLDKSACMTTLCGNGVIDAGEDCDGAVPTERSCAEEGSGFVGGALSCTSACKLDKSACLTTLCGNGVIDAGEDCDGAALGGKDCGSAELGFFTGTLDCTAACHFDTAACTNCGNGALDAGEDCDDADPDDHNDCTNVCRFAGCGDGIVWSAGAGREECDDATANSDTEPGACRTSCKAAFCGDGVRDPNELCEGSAGDHCCSTVSCEWVPANAADPQSVCHAMSGETVYVCGGADACVPVPEEQQEPTVKMDGLPSELLDVYDPVCGESRCPADGAQGFRALMGFPVRNRAALEERIRRMVDPTDPSFRHYMTPAEWVAEHAPSAPDFELVVKWLESTGMKVDFRASNRLLLQFSGTVAEFNAAFQTELLELSRESPQAGNSDFIVYGTDSQFTVPRYVAERVNGVITADLPASTKALPGESGDIFVSAPPEGARTLRDYRAAYGATELYEGGYQGQGVTLGLVVGASFKQKDMQSFWRSMGYCADAEGAPACLPGSEGFLRENPRVVETTEPAATRVKETNIDIEWAAGIAPKANVVVYQAPDARNTSIVFAWNEAIARGEASVITSSFAHREDSEPRAVREQYSDSAMMGAALGITLVAASGDTQRPDTPSSSPYVTAVGGTVLSQLDGVFSDVAWGAGDHWGSGSGPTRSFQLPYWQEGIEAISTDPANLGKFRAVVDVSTSATGFPVVVTWKNPCEAGKDCGRVCGEGGWCVWGGTSFSAPLFAGLVTLVNSYRVAQGLPVVGYLNPTLYGNAAVRATFRDVVTGGTSFYQAGPGWDYPSGWGTPNATALAKALP